MAHADELPREVVENLARQVGLVIEERRLARPVEAPAGAAARPRPDRRRPRAGRPRAGAEPEPAPGPASMNESFAIWTLSGEGVTRPDADLTQLAHQTGKWHHQVRVGEQATAFARSRPLGPGADQWRVQEFFDSPIAAKIDAAISWVDAHVEGDPLTRLLIVPAFHLHAFWMSQGGRDTLLVIDMPETFTHLLYNTLYSSAEFLGRLGQEHHITGLAPPRRGGPGVA